MLIEPTVPSGADQAMLEISARLASGLAHELGGLLFAMRMRLETLEATIGPNQDRVRPDLDALAAGVRELQGAVDALRLLAARAGTGRMVQARAIDLTTWWERTAKLARHVCPRGLTLVGRVGAPAGLEQVDLRRLTEATLLLVVDVGTGIPTGEGAVVVELAPRLRDRTLVLTFHQGEPNEGERSREADPGPRGAPAPRTNQLAGRARSLLRPIRGRIRAITGHPTRRYVLTLPLDPPDQ